MLPYYSIENITWLPSNTFGLLVMFGCGLGLIWTIHQARAINIPAKALITAFIYIVIPAYLGSHILAIVFYQPHLIFIDPAQLLKFNRGLSSIGGLLIATIAFILYLNISGNLYRWRSFGDALMQGFIVGWIFGRLACSLVHDHPGQFSDFFLAIQYPKGSRHDLGFYEFLYTLSILFPLSIYIHRQRFRAGSQLIMFCLMYSMFRFPADFLRVADAQYFGLTPAQYGCIGLLILAGLIAFYMPDKTIQADKT